MSGRRSGCKGAIFPQSVTTTQSLVVERLAKATGLTKTAVVERAIDRLAAETQGASDAGRMAALLTQLDRIPDREDAFDPRQWDEQGLPK